MLALYAAGRQVEALAAYRDLAGRLRELGLQPGEATRALERRILEHDARRSPPRGAAPARRGRAARAPGAGRAASRARAPARRARRARRGRRTGVMVRGEPGVGKSTLVDAFLARPSPGGAVGRRPVPRPPRPRRAVHAGARGARRAGPRPGRRPVVAALAQRAPTWLVELPWLLDDAADAEAVRQRAQGATRARMLREMLEALDAIVRAAPLLLVLEDLHWADDSTLDLLARAAAPPRPGAAARARHLPAGGRAAGRGARPRPRRARALRGARAPAARRATRSRPTSRRASPAARCRTASPTCWPSARAATRCSCATCSTTGSPTARWSSPAAPSGSRARARRSRPACRRRCARTSATSSTGSPPRTPRCCGAASVAGRDFSVDTLAAALERDREAGRGALRRARPRTRLIERRDGGHAFPHDLHREVLYELLPADARARGCTRASAPTSPTPTAEAPDMAAELGFHFVAGRDPERAVRFLRLAAERAFARNAHAEGIRHLRAALDAAARLADGLGRTRAEVELLSSLGQALVATGGWSAAEAEESLLRARDARRAAVGQRAARLGPARARHALRAARRVLARAGDGARSACAGAERPGDHELESTELLACNLFHQGSFARALEHAERGVALFEGGEAPGGYSTFPATLGDNAGRLLPRLGRARAVVPRPPGQRAGARDARARAGARPQPRLQPGHGARADGGRAPVPPRARGGARVGRGHDRRRPGARLRLPRGDGPRAARLGAARLGDPEQGMREIVGGLAASRATGARMDDPHYLGLLADAHLRAGDVDAGLAAVAEALELATAASARCSTSPSCTGSTARCTPWRATSIAEDALRRGLARAREQGSRRSSCGSPPTSRGSPRSRPRGRGAPPSRRSYARSRRASARATCARPPRCSEPALRRSRPPP